MGEDAGFDNRTYLEIVRQEMTEERFRKIVRAALEQAETGDRMAREWLSRYVLPENPEATDSDGRFKRIIFSFEKD